MGRRARGRGGRASPTLKQACGLPHGAGHVKAQHVLPWPSGNSDGARRSVARAAVCRDTWYYSAESPCVCKSIIIKVRVLACNIRTAEAPWRGRVRVLLREVAVHAVLPKMPERAWTPSHGQRRPPGQCRWGCMSAGRRHWLHHHAGLSRLKGWCCGPWVRSVLSSVSWALGRQSGRALDG